MNGGRSERIIPCKFSNWFVSYFFWISVHQQWRTMLQLCIIVSPPPWRWKHASHPDPNRGTPRTGFEWTNPALNGSSLVFSKVYSRSIFFWKQGATIEISQFDGGKRYKGGVEQWLNPLHSPWAQMKPSIEKFKLEMLFNTNLMPNLPTMYIYIYCKKNKYVCIYIIIFYALHVLYKHHPSHPIPHGTSGLIVKCISTKGTSSRLTARLAASKGGVILLPWYARKWTMNENVGFFLWKKMNIFPIVVLVLHSFTRTQLWISISCISIYIYIHIVY